MFFFVIFVDICVARPKTVEYCKSIQYLPKRIDKLFRNKPLFNLLFKTHILADFPQKKIIQFRVCTRSVTSRNHHRLDHELEQEWNFPRLTLGTCLSTSFFFFRSTTTLPGDCGYWFRGYRVDEISVIILSGPFIYQIYGIIRGLITLNHEK